MTRRIVQTWYTRKENAEGKLLSKNNTRKLSTSPITEKTLKELLNQQRVKVEEIKKKTNYYSTKNLIERYDASPAESPLRQRPGAGQKPIPPPGTPQQPGKPVPNGTPRSGPAVNTAGFAPQGESL